MIFEENYRKCMDGIAIPEFDINRIFSDHVSLKKKYMAQSIISAIMAVVILVITTSATVYAYNIIQRNINNIDTGIIVSNNPGESIIHEYNETNSSYIKSSDKLELQLFDSWDEAIKIIPFSIPIIKKDCKILISVQKDAQWHIEAVYNINEFEEIEIKYDIFDNKNWEYQKEYNGKILDEWEYDNTLGYVYNVISVALDEDIFTNYVIAFDYILVQIQFKNTSEEEQKQIVNQLNFEEVLHEKN